MTKAYHGEVVRGLLAALEAHGPMTHSLAASQAGVSRENARRTLNRLAAEPLSARRRAHICAWVDEFDNERTYPRPVFKLGPGSNKRRPPKRTRAQIVRDYMRRIQIKAGVNAFGPVLSQKAARANIAAQRRAQACQSSPT